MSSPSLQKSAENASQISSKAFSWIGSALIFLILPGMVQSSEIKTQLIDSQKIFRHEVEVWMHKPDRKPFSLLVFLHGASEKGIGSIAKEHLEYWVNKGYAVAAISMPGHGRSTGRKDLCGPFTIESLNFAIEAIKKEMEVSQFGIIGFGRGATAGMLIAAEREDVLCVLSANGVYDLVSHLKEGDLLSQRIVNGNDEVSLTKEDFQIRSPMERVSKIKCPILILHREKNPLVSVEEVKRFVDAIELTGNAVQVSILAKTPEVHEEKISYEEVLSEGENWIDLQMRNCR